MPSTVTVPADGISSAFINRTSVDLPEPFGPSTAKDSPGADGEGDTVERRTLRPRIHDAHVAEFDHAKPPQDD